VDLLVLTSATDPFEVLPALSLLPHHLRGAAAQVASVYEAAPCDVILVDARAFPADAALLCQYVRGAASNVPLVAVISERALDVDWAGAGIDRFMLVGAGPAEVDARLRLILPRPGTGPRLGPSALVRGGLVVDDRSYTAQLDGRILSLTRTEFELLRHLAHRPGEALTRAQLLSAIWESDSAPDERIVDVHIRRLRGKLGPQYRALIRTARGLGYKLIVPRALATPSAARGMRTVPTCDGRI
jgi:DNA-binding response OmpR family regulator